MKMTDKSYATVTRKSHSKILRLYNVYDILKDLPNDMQNVIITFTSHQSSLQLLEYIKFNIRHLLYKHLSGGASPSLKPPISEKGLEVGYPPSHKGGGLRGYPPSRNELVFYEEKYNCNVQEKKKKRKSKSIHSKKKKIKYVSKKQETLSRHRSSFEKYVLNNDYHMYNDYDHDEFYDKYYDYDIDYGYEHDYSDDDYDRRYNRRHRRYRYDDDMYHDYEYDDYDYYDDYYQSYFYVHV
jgi:hypothetical protein